MNTSNGHVLAQHFFKDGVTRNVRFGKSFLEDSSDDEQDQYHSVTYDFKPPSDAHSSTSIDMQGDKNVSITVAHREHDTATTYRGSAQEAARDCLLIYDPVNNEYVIERVKKNIRVKRTREGGNGGGAALPPTTSPRDMGVEVPGGAGQAGSSMPMFDANSDDEQNYSMESLNINNQPHHNHHQQQPQAPYHHQQQPQPPYHHQRSNGVRSQHDHHSSYNNQSAPTNQRPHQGAGDGGKDEESSSSSSGSSSSSDSDSSDSESEGEQRKGVAASAAVNSTTNIMGDLEISDDDDD